MVNPAESFRETTIGIIGLGQIGGSLAMALRAQTPATVLGYDVDPSVTELATERMIVHETPSLEQLLDRASIVIFATPHAITLGLLKDFADQLHDMRLVCDVGSVKAEVCRRAEELQLASFIGTHPMAGSERQCAEAWDDRLFDDAAWFYSPLTISTNSAREIVQRLVRAVGSRAIEVDPDRHDRLIALASGLPHAVAVSLESLAAMGGDDFRRDFVGPSFRSATRVAQSNPDLIRHLLFDNRLHVSEAIDQLIETLAKLSKDLKRNNRSAFDELWEN